MNRQVNRDRGNMKPRRKLLTLSVFLIVTTHYSLFWFHMKIETKESISDIIWTLIKSI